MSQPLKKQQIIGLFGQETGTKLLNWLDPCCNGLCEEVRTCLDSIFCPQVYECLGISTDGDPSLVLNKQGNWISTGGGGSPSAPDTSVQYNNGGSFQGDAGFTRNPITFETFIKTPNVRFAVGDFDNVANKTYLVVGDDSQQITGGCKLFTVGDIFGGTLYFVADVNLNKVYTQLNGNFIVQDNASHNWFNVDTLLHKIRIGDVSGTHNNTSIIIDDVAQRITVSNVPTFADDAAAVGGGLTTGQLYKTTTLGSTFLKIVP